MRRSSYYATSTMVRRCYEKELQSRAKTTKSIRIPLQKQSDILQQDY